MRPWLFLCALVLLAFIADPALAWGPTTHVGLANSVLEQLGLLPAAIAAILARHRAAYLYGSIAADVVFAKRWSRVKQFCHHWSTGFGLQQAGRTEEDKAFALGYLSHLAADTVAHGKFIPRQIALCDCSVNFGHLYWELRADAAEPPPMRQLLEEVLAGDHQVHHRQLAGHMTNAFLPYDVNRLLFDRLNALMVHQRFRLTIQMCGRLSRWELPTDVLGGYRQESMDRILSVLTEGSRSSVLREDPNGTSALMRLRVDRKRWRARLGRESHLDRRRQETSLALAPRTSLVGCS